MTTDNPVQEHGLGHVFLPDVKNADWQMRSLLPREDVAQATRPKSYKWKYPDHKLDQGNYGTCEGHSGKNHLLCEPIVQTTPDAFPTAIDIYNLSTELDGLNTPQTWHNLQSGTTTNGMMKALRQLGYIAEWRWAANMADVLDWLAFKGCLCVGINWRRGMFTPDANGFVQNTGPIDGGHAFIVIGYDESAPVPYALCVQSWGDGWGLHGEFKISLVDLEQLLFAEHGDVAAALEVLVSPPTPAPTPPPAPTPDPIPVPPTPPTPTPPNPEPVPTGVFQYPYQEFDTMPDAIFKGRTLNPEDNAKLVYVFDPRNMRAWPLYEFVAQGLIGTLDLSTLFVQYIEAKHRTDWNA